MVGSNPGTKGPSSISASLPAAGLGCRIMGSQHRSDLVPAVGRFAVAAGMALVESVGPKSVFVRPKVIGGCHGPLPLPYRRAHRHKLRMMLVA